MCGIARRHFWSSLKGAIEEGGNGNSIEYRLQNMIPLELFSPCPSRLCSEQPDKEVPIRFDLRHSLKISCFNFPYISTWHEDQFANLGYLALGDTPIVDLRTFLVYC